MALPTNQQPEGFRGNQNDKGGGSSNDPTPVVSIKVGGTEVRTKDYMMIQDVLSLGDAFSCTIPNPEGEYSGTFTPGDSVKIYMADPAVSGGASILTMTGILVSRDFTSNMQGSTIRLTCADLGWHLQNNTGPVWMRLTGLRFGQLLRRIIDPSWKFAGTQDYESIAGKRVRLGRAGAALVARPEVLVNTLPVLQVEPGETCADILIKYAKLSKKLVNVTSDGVLQLFSPNYKQAPVYTFHYHKHSETLRNKNNVESVQITDSIQGIYTDVSCYSYNVLPVTSTQTGTNKNNVNEGHFKGLYSAPTALPFVHRLSFGDAEQLNRDQARNRSAWKAQRGEFDSFQYVVDVYGHSQNGSFYIPDTMCTINDTMHGIKGSYYVQAVKYERNLQSGTKTTLTLRKPGLLGA